MPKISLDVATLKAILEGDEEAKAALLETAQGAIDKQSAKEAKELAEDEVLHTVMAWKEREIDPISPPLCVKLLKAEFEWRAEVGQFELSKRGLYAEYAGDMASEEMIALLSAIDEAENTDELILEDMASFTKAHLGEDRYNEILSQSDWPIVQTEIASKTTTGYSSIFHRDCGSVVNDGDKFTIGGQTSAVVTLLYNSSQIADDAGWSVSVKIGKGAKKGNGRRIANGTGKRVNAKTDLNSKTVRDYWLNAFVRDGCPYPDEKSQELVAEHGEASNAYNYTDQILRCEEGISEDDRLYTNAKAALAE
jgi:hypothetical protein